MSFTNNAEVIGSSDNTFHTVATGYEASVHALLIDNPSGSPETITMLTHPILIHGQLT